jgi:hypothetical protein
MSPQEILFRLREFLLKSADMRVHLRRPPRYSGGEEHYTRRITPPDQAGLARQFTDWDTFPETTAEPGWGELHLFGLGNWIVPQAVDWHRDYSSGRSAPFRPAWQIDIRDPDLIGNIKYIWEINRLQFLVPLAFRCYMTGRTEMASSIKACLDDWQEANPFLRGVNWTSALEAGVRLVSFFWIYLFTGEILEEDQAFIRRFRQCIFQHCWFIRRHHSYGSSANNHLIGELAGVYAIGRLIPFSPEITRYAAWAGRALQKASRHQVTADGVNREQAIAYHCFSLDFLLLAGWVGAETTDPFPDDFWDMIRRQVLFLQAIADRAGNYPAYGDSDSARAWWWGDTDKTRVMEFRHLAIGPETPRLRVRKPSLKWALLAATHDEGQPRHTSGLDVAHYPEGGFLVIKSPPDKILPGMHLVFFGNSLGFPPLYAHGHADTLSFYLSVGEKEFFIDPGTYAYHLHSEWRDYFRGTAAHNVIHCPAGEPVRWQGPFQARNFCRTELLIRRREEDYVFAQGARQDKRHRFRWTRDLHFFPAEGVICWRDHLLEPPGKAYIHFHLAESCRAELLADQRIIEIHRSGFCYLVSPEQAGWHIAEGETQPRRGWFSPGFDQKRPTLTIWAEVDESVDTFLVISRGSLAVQDVLRRCKDIGSRLDIAITG